MSERNQQYDPLDYEDLYEGINRGLNFKEIEQAIETCWISGAAIYKTKSKDITQQIVKLESNTNTQEVSNLNEIALLKSSIGELVIKQIIFGNAKNWLIEWYKGQIKSGRKISLKELEASLNAYMMHLVTCIDQQFMDFKRLLFTTEGEDGLFSLYKKIFLNLLNTENVPGGFTTARSNNLPKHSSSMSWALTGLSVRTIVHSNVK